MSKDALLAHASSRPSADEKSASRPSTSLNFLTAREGLRARIRRVLIIRQRSSTAENSRKWTIGNGATLGTNGPGRVVPYRRQHRFDRLGERRRRALAVAHHEAGVVRPERRQGLSDLLLQDGFRDRVLKPVAAPSAFGGVFSFADFNQVTEAATTAF